MFSGSHSYTMVIDGHRLRVFPKGHNDTIDGQARISKGHDALHSLLPMFGANPIPSERMHIAYLISGR